MLSPRSPAGGELPGGFGHQDRQRSPTTLFPDGSSSNRRPNQSFSSQGRRSPLGFYDPVSSSCDRRSPTSVTASSSSATATTVRVQDRHSPVGFLDDIDEGGRRSPSTVTGRRSPMGCYMPTASATMVNAATGTMMDRRISPHSMQLHIPPITVSNPTETCAIIEKSMELSAKDSRAMLLSLMAEKEKKDEAEKEAAAAAAVVPERKERSVMRDLLAFVRKPSKKVTTMTAAPASTSNAAATTTPAAATASTSRTGRFAAAFSRAESGSSTPLLRQSTFSTSPAASSRAGKSAVTKQISDAGFEPKLSFKLLNSKMSLRLRRATPATAESGAAAAAAAAAKRDARSSGDEMSDMESSDAGTGIGESSGGGISSDAPFELESVRFDKVSESYIKHDKIREETFEEASPVSPTAAVAQPSSSSDGCLMDAFPIGRMIGCGRGATGNDNDNDDTDAQMDLLKFQLRHMIGGGLGSGSGGIACGSQASFGNMTELQQLQSSTTFSNKAPNDEAPHIHTASSSNQLAPNCAATGTATSDMQIQCPTFEIMPPSRRSSFDPPRSPYLENMRSSPCDTEPELITLNRLDSGGDSFELVDTDRNRESSFESRYPSSSHTSFDISRYQSTSYDDQTSSFEIVDLDAQPLPTAASGRSPIDAVLRKSSVEMVDMDTFQRGCGGGVDQPLPGRKSSLETHFDYQGPAASGPSPVGGGVLGGLLTRAKRQVSEPNRTPTAAGVGISLMKTHHSAPNRARSPLSNQTSSNYSSRDSYDSGFEPIHPTATKSRQHFPLTMRPTVAGDSAANATDPATGRAFLCTDQRCSAIFEPRPCRVAAAGAVAGSSCGVQPQQQLLPVAVGIGGRTRFGEFEPPSPRRAASASPKHTFTFRIVLKKVDSSPDAICPSAERRRSRERNERLRRRDSRKKRLMDVNKSF